MSLKGGISATELLNTIEDAKKGKKKAIAKLSKYVESGAISTEVYNQIIEEIRTSPNKHTKDKKDRERSRKKKAVLCGVVAFIVLFVSMACGLVYFFEQYGKAIAVCYFFLWFWAIDYAVDKDTKSEKITKLELENELLKERLEIYKEVNKKSEATLQE